MNAIEYYMAINEKYHDEVYELLNTLEISFVDDKTAKEQQKALKRLIELMELTDNKDS